MAAPLGVCPMCVFEAMDDGAGCKGGDLVYLTRMPDHGPLRNSEDVRVSVP